VALALPHAARVFRPVSGESLDRLAIEAPAGHDHVAGHHPTIRRGPDKYGSSLVA